MSCTLGTEVSAQPNWAVLVASPIAEGRPFMDGRPLLIYTIGHSNHTTGEFMDLLQRHGIDAVVDVRSQPYSRWTPQFNREILSHQLQDAGITWRYMGTVLGVHSAAV